MQLEPICWRHGYRNTDTQSVVFNYGPRPLFTALKYGKAEHDWPEATANTPGAYADRDIAASRESLSGTVWSVGERCFLLVLVADLSVSGTQGEKNNGFDVLYHNMKHGQISSKELTDFIRERWEGRVGCTLSRSRGWSGLLFCLLCDPFLCVQGCFQGGSDSSSLYCVCSNTQFFAEATVYSVWLISSDMLISNAAPSHLAWCLNVEIPIIFNSERNQCSSAGATLERKI